LLMDSGLQKINTRKRSDRKTDGQTTSDYCLTLITIDGTITTIK